MVNEGSLRLLVHLGITYVDRSEYFVPLWTSTAISVWDKLSIIQTSDGPRTAGTTDGDTAEREEESLYSAHFVFVVLSFWLNKFVRAVSDWC